MSEYFNLFLNSIESCFSDILVPLDELFSFSSLALTFFIFSLIYRFLLKPLFGGSSGSSDQARKSKKGGK